MAALTRYEGGDQGFFSEDLTHSSLIWASVTGGYSGSNWRGLRNRVFGFKSGFVRTTLLLQGLHVRPLDSGTRFALEFRLKAQLGLGGALFRRKHGKPHDCNCIGRNERARSVASHSRLVRRHDDRVVRLLYFWKPCRSPFTEVLSSRK